MSIGVVKFLNFNCTEISSINQFKNGVFVFYLCFHRFIQRCQEKLSLALMKAKIVRFLTDLNVEDGINSKDTAFARYGG